MVIERIQVEETSAAVASVVKLREVRRHLDRAADLDGRGIKEWIAGKTLDQILDSCDHTLRNIVPNEARNPSA